MGEDEVQNALYNKMINDSGLMSAVKSILVAVPQPDLPEDDSEFPYISFGKDQTVALDTKTTFGQSVVSEINVWSRQNNYIEAKEISGMIGALLHHTTLDIVGYNHTMTIVESKNRSLDEDMHTKRGLIIVRVEYDNSQES